jgi:hypothetical protein
MSPKLEYIPEFCQSHPDERFDPFARLRDTQLAAWDDIIFQTNAEAALHETAERETGQVIPADKAAERESRDIALRQQSRLLVQRMRDAGREYEPEAALTKWQVYPFSGHIVKAPNYRRCMIIPLVAQQVRRPMLQAVRVWLYNNPDARMWTFTGGPRVALGPGGKTLRDALAKFHRDQNRLRLWLRRVHHIDVVFRATELGEVKFDETTKEPTFHLHAHCLVKSLTGYRNADRWAGMLRDIHHHWGHVWQDNGAIRSANEVVKYCAKPGDMLRLSGSKLLDLADALARMKMVVPLGSLKESIARTNRARQRIDWQPTPEGPVPVEVPNHNLHRPRTDAERLWDRANRLSNRRRTAAEGGCPDMQILARHPASFAPGSRIKEPSIIVLSATPPKLEEVCRHRLVAPLLATCRPQWEAGLALARADRAAASDIKVHTCTPTGIPAGPPGTAGPLDRPEMAVQGAAK